MILELYSTILVPLYSEWLCIDDLAHLDVGVCNTTLRESFVGQLTKCSVLPAMWYSMYGAWEKDAMDWLYTRGIKLRGVDISYFDGLTLKQRKYSILCDKIEWLALPDCGCLDNVLNHCSLISALKLSRMNDESFINFIPMLSNLQILDVGHHQISTLCMTAIVEICSYLRVFLAEVDATIIIKGCRELSEVKTRLNSRSAGSLINSSSVKSLHLMFDVDDTENSDSDAEDSDVEDERNVLQVIRSKPFLVSFSCDITIGDEVLLALSECCPQLTYLNAFRFDSITDIGLIALSKCNRLQELHITSNSITDCGVTEFVKGCPNLTVLAIRQCRRLTDIGVLNILRYCQKLKDFDVWSPKFTDAAFLRAFAVRPSLRLLYGENFLSSKSVIGNIFDGEYLLVNGFRFDLKRTLRSSIMHKLIFGKVSLSLADWSAIFSLMPSLLKVQFFCLDITDEVIATLASFCPLLMDVCINNCTFVTEHGTAALIRFGANLKRLKILRSDFCANTADNETLCKHASKLTYLVLQHCADSWILDVVATMCQMLKSIEVTNSGVKSDALCRVIRSCPQLTHMDVSHCSQVDASVLQAICELVASGSRQWKSVNVEGCDGITKKDAAKYLRVLKNAGVECSFDC